MTFKNGINRKWVEKRFPVSGNSPEKNALRYITAMMMMIHAYWTHTVITPSNSLYMFHRPFSQPPYETAIISPWCDGKIRLPWCHTAISLWTQVYLTPTNYVHHCPHHKYLWLQSFCRLEKKCNSIYSRSIGTMSEQFCTHCKPSWLGKKEKDYLK